MNFDEAISAHTGWKTKLRRYIDKPDGSLKSGDVSPDNNCPLGKWIHGVGGTQHSQLPEFSALTKEHARFHTAAGDVIRKADLGQRMTEEVALGSNSEYGTASAAVVKALVAMKSKLGH